MTKKQHEDRKYKLATQAKQAEGLDWNYNFNNAHSGNSVAGLTDDGTAITTTRKPSLGEMAYNVVAEDNNSDLDDIIADQYKDKEGVEGMYIELDQVCQDTGKQLHGQEALSDDGGGTASSSRELQTSLTRPSGSNEGSSSFANDSSDRSLS
jgi:hypothetical protein